MEPIDAAWVVLKGRRSKGRPVGYGKTKTPPPSTPDSRLRRLALEIGQDPPRETGTLYGAPLSEEITPNDAVLDTIDEYTEAETREQAKENIRDIYRGKAPTWDQQIAQQRLKVIQPYGEGAPLRRQRRKEQQPHTSIGSVANPGQLVRRR
tara:strand:+ start:278 stop:730 length:453 start_codon:yes stop_codon:yes gene_type:complete